MNSTVLNQTKQIKNIDKTAIKKQELLAIDLAVERTLRLAKPISETEIIALKNAHNRILAQEIISPFPQPPFDNSAMDGYAVRLSELKGDAPWTLEVVDSIHSGERVKNIQSGAVRIFTGSAVPKDIDAVIMQEHVSVNQNFITIAKKPRKGENIRRKGEDISNNQVLVSDGEIMTPANMALAASAGVEKISVYRMVRVAFLSTGTELVQPGEKLAASQIYNSNRFLLLGLLDRSMIELIDLGALPDDNDKIAKTLKEAAQKADVIITCGAILFGQKDKNTAFMGNNIDIQILKMAIKPGKPLVFGNIENSVYIGLPGNPLAAHVNFKMIAKPIIEKLAGQKNKKEISISAISSFDRARRPLRHEYLPVKITGNSKDGTLLIKLLGKGGSAEMLPIAQADGLAVITPGEGSVNSGDRVRFIPL